MVALRTAALLACLLSGCGSPETTMPDPADQPVPEKPANSDPQTPPAAAVQGKWSGPAVHAAWTRERALRIHLTAPTAGFELRCDEVVLVGTTAEVRCAMTKPHDEVVAQVITEHDLDVAADKFPAGATEAAVLISTWERGVQYFRAPDHERVLTLPLGK